MYSGSVNVTKLKDAIARGVVDGWTGKNGDEFVNVTVFVNEVTNEYGHDGAIKASTPMGEADQKVYLCNLKKVVPK